MAQRANLRRRPTYMKKLKPFEVEVVPELQAGVDRRKTYTNQCYKKSCSYFLRHDKVDPRMRLVHGWVTHEGLIFPYAWVEIGDVVFDGCTQRFYTRHGYYTTLSAIKGRTYTARKVFQAFAKNPELGSGPWHVDPHAKKKKEPPEDLDAEIRQLRVQVLNTLKEQKALRKEHSILLKELDKARRAKKPGSQRKTSKKPRGGQ